MARTDRTGRPTHMMEFLLLFAATLLVMVGFVLLQARLRIPRYRTERADLRDLLQDALAGRARTERWDLIIGIPVRHDEQLEAWRLRLVTLADQGRPGARKNNGISYCHFHPGERELLQRILQEMTYAERGLTRRSF